MHASCLVHGKLCLATREALLVSGTLEGNVETQQAAYQWQANAA